MSVTHIPPRVKEKLWRMSAGRCEYEGCNKPLWLDTVTKSEINGANIAHIVSDKPDGPRGDPVLSAQLKDDINNLMLMCGDHHRLIDHEDVTGHPVDRLQRMKATHEARIELVTGICPNKQSHVLLYGANIGEHNAPVSCNKAFTAMLPDWYPADAHPITLGMKNSSFQDRDLDYWQIEGVHLRQMVTQIVRPRLAEGAISHLSIFAVAPQPLLMLLGFLLCDLQAADVFQLHREPPDWCWQYCIDSFVYSIAEPDEIKSKPALVISLSASISDERITAVLGNEASIWRITIPNPNNDFLKSREQVSQFRQQMRSLMNHIKSQHGENATIHVFPAMPVALAVELGRIIMPKADLPLRIYDQNQKLGGFVHALDIDTRGVN
jgi:hypothetical protein